jgi:hypothetical protein
MVDLSLFLMAVVIGTTAPVIAVAYLKPILTQVLRTLCDAPGGAEFWIRCAYVLAVSGTMLLMLVFGEFREGASPVDALRKALGVVFAGVFVTVAIISRNVWTQVRAWLVQRQEAA